MPRRIYIVPQGAVEAHLATAKAAGAAEIADGIPPSLTGVVTEAMLPYLYEEPDLPSPPSDPDAELIAAIESATTLQELKNALLGKWRRSRSSAAIAEKIPIQQQQ